MGLTRGELAKLVNGKRLTSMARIRYQELAVRQVTEKRTGRVKWMTTYRTDVLGEGGKIERPERDVVLGYTDELSETEAIKLRDELRNKVNGAYKHVAASTKVKDFLEVYRTDHLNLPKVSPATKGSYDGIINRYLLDSEVGIGELQLGDVTELHAQRIINKAEANGVHWCRLQTIKWCGSSIFTKARKWRYITGVDDWVNPFQGVDTGEQENVKPYFVPDDETIDKLINACEFDYPLMIRTSIVCTTRISELVALTVADIDFVNLEMRINKRTYRGVVGRTKSKESRRVVPLTTELAAELKAHCKGKFPTDVIFRDEHGNQFKWASWQPLRYLNRRMEELGIKVPGFAWHTFRRKGSSEMLNGGMDELSLASQLGHSDLKVTRKYVGSILAKRKTVVQDVMGHYSKKGSKVVRMTGTDSPKPESK